MINFAKELKKAVDEGRITVADLAEKTGLSRMQIYRLIDGENSPNLDTAALIAKHIGLKLTLEPAV